MRHGKTKPPRMSRRYRRGLKVWLEHHYLLLRQMVDEHANR